MAGGNLHVEVFSHGTSTDPRYYRSDYVDHKLIDAHDNRVGDFTERRSGSVAGDFYLTAEGAKIFDAFVAQSHDNDGGRMKWSRKFIVRPESVNLDPFKKDQGVWIHNPYGKTQARGAKMNEHGIGNPSAGVSIKSQGTSK